MFKWKVVQIGDNFYVTKTNLFGTTYMDASEPICTWRTSMAIYKFCAFKDVNKAFDLCCIANNSGKEITIPIPE